MLQGLKDYTKCVIRNKFVFAGYSGLGLLALSIYVQYKTGISILALDASLFISSLLTLGFTEFGLGTFKAYIKAKKCIEDNGNVDPRVQNLFSSTYCSDIGVKIAMEEAGLENLVSSVETRD